MIIRNSWVALLLLLTGCYSYATAPIGAPGRGSGVRAHLTAPESFDIGEITVQNVVQVEGEVVTWDDDTLTLSAMLLESGSGQEFLGKGYTVYVPRQQIADLEQKKISSARTGLVVGAGIVVAALTGALMAGGVGGGDGPGNGGQTK